MNIVVTGSNRGLGIELVKEAVRRGHKVWAGVRDTRACTGLREIAEGHPGMVEIVQLDVTNETEISSFARRLGEAGQTVHSLINNAAVVLGRSEGPLEQLELDRFAQSMDVNVFGPIRMVKHFSPLLEVKRSTIIHISSASGTLAKARAGDYPYAISKAALNMFTQEIHHLFEPKGIRVFAVHPGWLRTDMGGTEAPEEPVAAAPGIMNLAEGKKRSEGPYVFVDRDGHALPI